jgi:hypothetical protein
LREIQQVALLTKPALAASAVMVLDCTFASVTE